MPTPRVMAVATALLFAGAPVQAGAPKKASNPVLSGAYDLDPGRTQVGFVVEHVGFSAYSGHFSNASGGLVLGLKSKSTSKSQPKSQLMSAPSAAVHISVPVGSVSTDNEMLDDELKGTDWLDARTFPTMTFTSTSVTTDGETEAKVDGELTLHGVTRPVTFAVRFIGAGINPADNKATAGFEIRGDVKRSAFGVDKFTALVSDDVHLSINAAFEKQ